MEKEIILDGKKLLIRIYGEGPLLLFVHGFGETGDIWQRQIEALKGFRIAVPDLPGTGASEMVEDMSMEGMATLLKQMLEQEFPGEVPVLIGHSMGGYIILAFAELFPGYSRGLALVHSTVFADSEEKKENRRKGIDFIEQHGAIEFLKTTIPNLYGPFTKEENPGIIEEHINQAHNFSGAALVSYYVSMINRPDRGDVLRKAKYPVFIAAGKYDQAVSFEDSLKMAHMADISYIHVFDRSGHMGMIEETEKMNRLIREYINQL